MLVAVRAHRHVEAVGRPPGVHQAATGDHRRHRVPRARLVHHGRAVGLLANGDGHAVRGQPDTVHRRGAAHPAGEHVLLDHVHVHHAGRVPPRAGRQCRAPRSRPRVRRRAAQVLHVLPVGVLRPVPAGHDVLLPQVAVGHAGGRAHVHAGDGPALRAGRRAGEGKPEEDTRPLHADAHQSEYLPPAM